MDNVLDSALFLPNSQRATIHHTTDGGASQLAIACLYLLADASGETLT